MKHQSCNTTIAVTSINSEMLSAINLWQNHSGDFPPASRSGRDNASLCFENTSTTTIWTIMQHLMHYKCSRSEARSYLPDREAGGESPEWLCDKFIAGNISEWIDATAMLQVWCFISIFEDYDSKNARTFSRDEHDTPQKQKNWARETNTEINSWWCSLTNYHFKLAATSFLYVNECIWVIKK